MNCLGSHNVSRPCENHMSMNLENLYMNLRTFWKGGNIVKEHGMEKLWLHMKEDDFSFSHYF